MCPYVRIRVRIRPNGNTGPGKKLQRTDTELLSLENQKVGIKEQIYLLNKEEEALKKSRAEAELQNLQANPLVWRVNVQRPSPERVCNSAQAGRNAQCKPAYKAAYTAPNPDVPKALSVLHHAHTARKRTRRRQHQGPGGKPA
ncbi:uncharacterized protein K452DRAFT_306682 [Aplosporella prunicola CBS 121167]|uniref:Uncharacterized protein n=1 Tax=Aplosporella prunicola CBS 121167 TaxID=1176127 RepID=A0A6A6BJ52_9PEZI|nr:uncharacterized protein K452DRAFT_306682 [Aplosporella prunicola CBS 121167]KAF2144046.1 hypothetical protein K452DRAFT_306682 [Aplosporella prunicola CBS 121167]